MRPNCRDMLCFSIADFPSQRKAIDWADLDHETNVVASAEPSLYGGSTTENLERELGYPNLNRTFQLNK